MLLNQIIQQIELDLSIQEDYDAQDEIITAVHDIDMEMQDELFYHEEA